MDSAELDEKLKRHEAYYANYLKAKYFSDKDIYGEKIFEEKAIFDGMIIRASRDRGTKSYADPAAYWNEKFSQTVPKTETTTSTTTTSTTTANLSNGKHSAKKN
ncbi:uncharacterized protein [Rutidosis leptorrhynchoides]|uniref:uncharacterized protein n=1 Tax=Rutidosis leptorrhynchoides TaxID=125765 RepID=UPI003A99BEDA